MSPFRHLMEIAQVPGRRRVVAFLHSSSGSASGFRRLAGHMQSPARYVAFEATEPGDKCSVPEIAKIYWDELRPVLREETPADLVLVGWSFGGALAVEITRLAESQHHVVAHVVMLDAATPALLGMRRNSEGTTAMEAAVLFGITDGLPETPLDDESLAEAILARLPQGQDDLLSSDLMPYIRTHRWHVEALSAPWQPAACSAPVTQIRARDEECWAEAPADLGWSSALDQEIRLLSTPGTHHTLLAAEHIPELARTIDDVIGHGADGVATAREIDGGLPLSSPQARLWFLWQLEPDGAHYTTQFGWWIPETTPDDVQSAWRRLCDRQAMLRSSYRTTATGEPRRFIDDSASVELIRIASANATDAVTDLAAEQFRMPFDLRRGSVRAVIAGTDRGDVCLLVSCHHIAVDGWCLEVIEKDVRWLLAHPGTELPTLPVDYQDFVAWEQAIRSAPSYDTQLAYWTDVLKDAKVTPPPADLFEDSAVGAGSLRFDVPAEIVHGLEKSAAQAGVTPFAAVLTCISISMREWAGSSGVAIGVNLANRPRSGFEDVVGLFVDPVTLWLTPPSQGNLSQLVEHVWDRLVGAFEHSDVPYQDVVGALASKDRDPWNPLFWVIVNLDQSSGPPQPPPWEPIPSIAPPDAKFPFAVLLRRDDRGMGVDFLYPKDRYRPDTIARVRRRFEQLMQCVSTSGFCTDLPPMDTASVSADRFTRRFETLRGVPREIGPGRRT